MLGSTSNLSIDGQQATVDAIAAAAKRKEDNTTATAQAAAATMHREQEAIITAVAAARKTLVEARARERAATLAWEKEQIIAYHLEQQLATAQGIAIPQDDDDDRSVNADSTRATHGPDGYDSGRATPRLRRHSSTRCTTCVALRLRGSHQHRLYISSCRR
jgi:hypothetical protein